MKRGLVFAGCCALLFAGVASIVSAQQGPAVGDPLGLFEKMMPVFGHPRCLNCHGGVNPYDSIFMQQHFGPGAVAHGGPQLEDRDQCDGCHDSASASAGGWRLAPPKVRFFGKSAKDLCKLQSAEAISNRGAYLRHLSTDALIGAAFEGDRGGARGVSDRPPMSRDDFVQAAAAWLDSGSGMCSTWTGLITQTESFKSNYDFPSENGIASVTGKADRETRITREFGSTTAEIRMSGYQTLRLVSQDGSCTTTATSKNDWNNTASAGARPATVRFQIAPDGSYRIQFRGPPEKTHTSDNDSTSSSCGSPPQPLPGDADLDWDPWVFNIRCPLGYAINPTLGEAFDCDLFDAKQWPRLKGSLTRVLVDRSDAADPQSWLMTSPASVGRADTGEQLPVKVVTEWDFVLVE